ncbi:MAG TPA: hypothetical protein VIO11_03740 [Candidatus Methanoperedens sp.]
MEAKKKEIIKQFQRAAAYDEAIGKLQDAGVAEEFLKAVKDNPELLEAVKNIAPDVGPIPLADWSCYVTVSRPLVNRGQTVINPAPISKKEK